MGNRGEFLAMNKSIHTQKKIQISFFIKPIKMLVLFITYYLLPITYYQKISTVQLVSGGNGIYANVGSEAVNFCVDWAMA
jgi:hypothetical protein